MMHTAWWRVRNALVAGCLVAATALTWRARDVVAELQRDRLAAETLAQAAALRMERRYEEAAAAFREAIAISPRATAAYDGLGEVEFRRGRFTEAIAAYRQLMAEYPYAYLAEPHRQVGLVELRAGLFREAVGDLTEAVTLDPNDWVAFYWLGHAHARLGDPASARAAWQRVMQLKPDFRPAREQLRRLDAQHR